MQKIRLLTASALVLLATTACGKKEEPAQAASAAATPPPAQQPAATQPTEAPAEDPELAKRKAAMEFALAEQKIAEDPQGQWAATATASSSYHDAKEQESYSAWQTTGVPNTQQYGDTGTAWATKDADAGIEWLEVGFAKPVHATALRIRQNHKPGAIIKLELIDDQKAKHTIFEGVDPTTYPENQIVWFIQTFEKTAFTVTGARITLATNAVAGWNEIDAVQLIGE
jgi:hypothetical protein